MYCMECGGKNERDNAFCIHCGLVMPRHTATTGSEDKTPCRSDSHEPTAEVRGLSERRRVAAITVGAVTALFIAAFVFTGGNTASLPRLLLLFFPLILGAIVFLARIGKPVSWNERLHSLTVRTREANAGKSNFLHRRFLGPLLFGLSKALQWPDGIKDPYLRSGIRISASLYFIGLMAYISLSILIVIVLLGIALSIATFALDSEDGDPVKTTSYAKRTEGRAFQDAVLKKCANCANYIKQVWSVDFECNLGRPTPDFDDTDACRFYREQQAKKGWNRRRKDK
jgi:hypothetical protein